jgi:bacteriophage HK97-gp10 putative tail-component
VAGSEIRIEGLIDFQKALRAADAMLPRELRLIFNDAATMVADAARPMMPSRTGALRASLKAASQQRVGQVKEGSARVPYAGFIDFGGAVGRHKSVHRPFIAGGRYMSPAYRANRSKIEEMLATRLLELARRSGLV